MQLKPSPFFLRPQGIALVIVLVTIVLVASLGTMMLTRTVGETRSSGDSATVVQNLMLARGAMAFAGAFTEATGKSLLSSQVTSNSSTTDAWAFGGNGTAPSATTLATQLDIVAANTQTAFDNVLCGMNIAPTDSGATVNLRIFFTPTPSANSNCTLTFPSSITLPEARFVRGNARTATNNVEQVYALPFVAIAQSQMGNYQRRIVLQGEYQFSINRTSFARYAYFANQRTSGLYFSDNDLIDGPVHSNQYLRFSGRPWYGDQVTVAGCTNPTLTTCGTQNQGDDFGGTIRTVAQIGANGGPCFSNNCPTFVNSQYNFSSSFIPLPDANQTTRLTNAANGATGQPANTGGIYFSSSLNTLTLFAGDNNGNYLQGTSGNPVNWQTTAATFQYVVGCTSTASTSCTLYRVNPPTAGLQGGTLQRWTGTIASTCPNGACTPTGTGSWTTVQNTQGQNITNFNGVIYTNGDYNVQGPPRAAIGGSSVCTATLATNNPDCAPPAVAAFSQLTVANAGVGNDVTIPRDLKYESPPCTGSPARTSVTAPVTLATCNNTTATNILGIYSQDGNVEFGPASNRPVDLTVHGVVMSGTAAVRVNTFSSGNDGDELRVLGGMIGNTVSGFRSGSSGYQRRITYDRRLANGIAPPFFPVTSQSGVLDTFTFTFGQREQIQ